MGNSIEAASFTCIESQPNRDYCEEVVAEFEQQYGDHFDHEAAVSFQRYHELTGLTLRPTFFVNQQGHLVGGQTDLSTLQPLSDSANNDIRYRADTIFRQAFLRALALKPGAVAEFPTPTQDRAEVTVAIRYHRDDLHFSGEKPLGDQTVIVEIEDDARDAETNDHWLNRPQSPVQKSLQQWRMKNSRLIVEQLKDDLEALFNENVDLKIAFRIGSHGELLEAKMVGVYPRDHGPRFGNVFHDSLLKADRKLQAFVQTHQQAGSLFGFNDIVGMEQDSYQFDVIIGCHLKV